MKKIIILLLFLLTGMIAQAGDSTFRFRTSDNTNLYVRVAGKGQPCLFVHGGPGSTSYYFEAMPSATLIEQQLTMIYYDQRGSGRSETPANGDYSAARMVKDMEELRAYLKINQWHVMGHSFGGLIMTAYALRHPANLISLMYIHATLNMNRSMQSHIDFGIKELGMTDTSLFNKSIPVEQRVWKVHEKLTEKNLWYKLMYRNAYEKRINDSVTASIGNANWDFAQKVWNVADYSRDLSLQTSKIKIPTLVMTGDKDYAIGIDHYKAFAFPNQKVVHYIGGHAPFQEEPQWFAEQIIAFVESLRAKKK